MRVILGSMVLLLLGCGAADDRTISSQGDAERGAMVFETCASCHAQSNGFTDTDQYNNMKISELDLKWIRDTYQPGSFCRNKYRRTGSSVYFRGHFLKDLAEGFIPLGTGVPAWPGEVRYLESFPRRLRMLLHDECLTDILEGSNAGQYYDQNGALLVESAQLHREPRRGLMLQLFDDILRPMGREHVAPQAAWDALVYQATGQRIAELYGDRLLISPAKPVSQLLSSSWFTQWRAVRRRLHEQCREEIF